MISTKTQNFAKKFLREHKVTCHFNSCDSWADCRKSHVALEINVPTNEFYSLMCHELQHILAFRSKKFYKYHHDKASSKYMWRNGLRIERWIDRKARTMFEHYFPDLRFVAAYSSKESLDYYYEWLEDKYPLAKEVKR